MTEFNVQNRQPAKMDYASPIQFRFKCTKLPEVEFTCQTANIPGIAEGSDRFPGSTRSTAASGTSTPQPLSEGGTYSDATLTILNSKNIAKTEIRFQNVYPTSLGSLSYDVKLTDVDYLQAAVSFNYMYYEIVQVSTT